MHAVAGMRTLRLYLMREIARCGALPVSQDLSHLPHERLEPMMSIMEAKTRAAIANLTHDMSLYSRMTENIVAVVLALESHLVRLATSWTGGRSDAEAQSVLVSSQRSYLSMLAFAIQLTTPVRGAVEARSQNTTDQQYKQITGTTTDTARVHNLAILHQGLDTFPDWLTLAIDAATQNLCGEGPLAHAGFDLLDLKM